jgi:release factor glutamine methyltransferase
MTTYQDVLKKASKIIDNFDAELILSHVTGKSRAKIFSAMKSSLLEIDELKFWQFAQKRSKGFPLAYITGVKEFWKGEFKVNKNVLIPRPETEVLIEELLKEDLREKKLIELGTGSGCIAISIANEINDLSIYATDFSIEAILVARENAEINKSKNIIFINNIITINSCTNC